MFTVFVGQLKTNVYFFFLSNGFWGSFLLREEDDTFFVMF